MERTVVIHASHAEAAAADREALRQLTPQQRLDSLLRMHHAWRERYGDAGRGLARVARVVRLPHPAQAARVDLSEPTPPTSAS